MKKYIRNTQTKAAKAAVEDQGTSQYYVLSKAKELLQKHEAKELFIILAALATFYEPELICGAVDRIEEIMTTRDHDIFRVIKENFDFTH